MAKWRTSTHPETKVEFDSSLRTVTAPHGWLNDHVVDELTYQCAHLPGAAPGIQLVPVLTVNMLLDGPESSQAAAERAVKRQSLRVRATTAGVLPALHTAERLCMVRNVDSSHWYILVIDPVPQKYYILDPLGRRYEPVLADDTRRRMPEVFDMVAAIRGEAASTRPWRQVPTFFPHQKNSFDCGVFAICGLALLFAGANLATLGTNPWIQQSQMPRRRREVAEIFKTGNIPAAWPRRGCSALPRPCRGQRASATLRSPQRHPVQVALPELGPLTPVVPLDVLRQQRVADVCLQRRLRRE